jgi:hypothetical protein
VSSGEWRGRRLPKLRRLWRAVFNSHVDVAARAGACTLAAAMIALVGGCAAPVKAPSRTSQALSDSVSDDIGSGMTLVRLALPAETANDAELMGRITAGGTAAPIACALSTNGFTLLRIKAADLPELVRMFGGAHSIRREALGSPLLWTELASTRVQRGTVAFVGGRPARTDSDMLLTLAMRGWSFPTIDSAATRIELRMTESQTTLDVISLDPSVVRPRPRELRDGEVVIELAQGEALLLLATPSDPQRRSAADGPSAPLPPTLAALLLDQELAENHAILLALVPSVGDMLPPAQDS